MVFCSRILYSRVILEKGLNLPYNYFMRKVFALSIVLGIGTLYAEEIRYFETQGFIYGENRGIYYRIPVWLTYDPAKDIVRINYDGLLDRYAFVLNKRDRKILREYIGKYLEWVKEARKRGMLVGRTFGVIKIPLLYNFRGMGWSYDPSVSLKIKALGKSFRYMLVLDITSSMYASGSAGEQVDDLFLMEKQAKQLYEALSDEFIKKAVGSKD